MHSPEYLRFLESAGGVPERYTDLMKTHRPLDDELQTLWDLLTQMSTVVDEQLAVEPQVLVLGVVEVAADVGVLVGAAAAT